MVPIKETKREEEYNWEWLNGLLPR
jgi:hypothetical protein